MSCNGCPEHAPSDSPGEGLIVYTGGPTYAPFACVELAIPPDQEGVITKWSRPTIHDDGAIEYKRSEAEPPEIVGYQKDANNPWLLRPIWSHCVWRAYRVWRTDDGHIKLVAMCITPDSGIAPYVTLTPEKCRYCKARAT